MKIQKKIDDIFKKIREIEKDDSKVADNESSQVIEKEKLRRFDLYHAIRLEKYKMQGGDPTFGNLDAQEITSEEFEYYLSHNLNNYTPEERYRQRKEHYYFHPSYIEMEKIDDWKERAMIKYCTGEKCVLGCPYYDKNSRIGDEQVIREWMEDKDIVEIDDYRKELGKELIDSILDN
ncbi:MAG: hypothetical protein H0X03_03810 [Nitrosopumilus sp.]|nr:hypothetical protein [Nitrosopumilus sp.]